jgi:hypothetical protein
MAGNFSLLRQRKVTKREALNRTPAPQANSAQDNNPSLSATMRPAAVLVTRTIHRSSGPPNARLHAVLTKTANAASLGRRGICIP